MLQTNLIVKAVTSSKVFSPSSNANVTFPTRALESPSLLWVSHAIWHDVEPAETLTMCCQVWTLSHAPQLRLVLYLSHMKVSINFPARWVFPKQPASALMHSADIGTSCRQKRDDNCLTCDRPHARTDSLARKYNSSPECCRSMMICKKCRAQHLSNVTLHTEEQGFTIWCFEEGLIKILVCTSLSSHTSISLHTACQAPLLFIASLLPIYA